MSSKAHRCAFFDLPIAPVHHSAPQTSGTDELRSTQFTILIAVAKAQPASISTLGSILLIDSTTLTRSLAKLQKQGLITVSKRAERRQRFVNLTEAGVEALREALPGWRAAHERFIKTVGAEFWLGYRRELERLAHVAVDLDTTEDGGRLPEPSVL